MIFQDNDIQTTDPELLSEYMAYMTSGTKAVIQKHTITRQKLGRNTISNHWAIVVLCTDMAAAFQKGCWKTRNTMQRVRIMSHSIFLFK